MIDDIIPVHEFPFTVHKLYTSTSSHWSPHFSAASGFLTLWERLGSTAVIFAAAADAAGAAISAAAAGAAVSDFDGNAAAVAAAKFPFFCLRLAIPSEARPSANVPPSRIDFALPLGVAHAGTSFAPIGDLILIISLCIAMAVKTMSRFCCFDSSSRKQYGTIRFALVHA